MAFAVEMPHHAERRAWFHRISTVSERDAEQLEKISAARFAVLVLSVNRDE
jgi:hypothetical protein